MACSNPYLLSSPDLLSARQKLGEVASFNDAGKLDFSGFKREALEPHAFRQQLEGVFNLKLTNAELGALVTFFDKNGDGRISHIEFLHDFFILGKNRREVKVIKNNSQRRKQDEKQRMRKEHMLNTIVPMNLIVLPKTWTKEQEASAAKKILQAALSYNGKRFQIEVCTAMISFV